MNKAVKKLFSCSSNNRVIVIDSNFTDFMEILEKHGKEQSIKFQSTRTYFQKFKEDLEFTQIIDGNEYCFQKLV